MSIRRCLRSIAPVVALGALLCTPDSATAQSTLERTPNLDAAWTGVTGSAYVHLTQRYLEADGSSFDLAGSPTFDFGFALPRSVLAGLRFASESTLAPSSDEWEPYLRWTPLHEGHGALPEAGVTIAYNSASESPDAAVSLARWLGPFRLIGNARMLGSPEWSDGAEFVAGGGAVLHVLAGKAPIALAGDWTTLLDRPDGIEPAWSAGLQVGVPFTANTLSLHATNSATTTLEGRSISGGDTRYGLELTVPLGIGAMFGMYAPREVATRAVVLDSTGPVALHARIARYAFEPIRIDIVAGQIIEWTNVDGVMHTVNAEDGAWHSGAIPPGESWRARFDEPGRYPFFCGPHPFMKGIVVVRAP